MVEERHGIARQEFVFGVGRAAAIDGRKREPFDGVLVERLVEKRVAEFRVQCADVGIGFVHDDDDGGALRSGVGACRVGGSCASGNCAGGRVGGILLLVEL